MRCGCVVGVQRRAVAWRMSDLSSAVCSSDPGEACLKLERWTWRGGALVTYVRQVFPGARYDLVAEFKPCSVWAALRRRPRPAIGSAESGSNRRRLAGTRPCRFEFAHDFVQAGGDLGDGRGTC